MKRKLILFFLILFLTGGLACAQEKAELLIFYSPSCHNCIKAKKEIIPVVEKEFKRSLRIVYYDVSNVENYGLLIGLRQKHDPALKITIPVFFLNGKFLEGDGLTIEKLRQFVSENIILAPVAPLAPRADLNRYFNDFALLAVISAGLIDGINPCAFTVIVFFISFLAVQGFRRRELVIIGLAFIAMVFLTYLLIGLGLFGFLYRLSGFWVIVKVINYTIGIFSIVLGVVSIYDLLKFKQTKNAEAMLLQLPKPVKDQIHKIIGQHYRIHTQGANAPRPVFKLIISALITGFLVSVLEAVCTGQTYLPTIAFVLKTNSFNFRALVFLFIYNLMFILPLLVIFIFALFGATSAQFAGFLKKHMLAIKALLAILFFGLGSFLIWGV